MSAMIGLLSGLYFVLIIGIVGFILYMLFRFVKAFEKIADTYSKRNSSV